MAASVYFNREASQGSIFPRKILLLRIFQCENTTFRTISSPAGNYMFKVNIGHWRRSDVFIVNFEHISHLVLVFLLLTLNMQTPAGSGVLISLREYFPLVNNVHSTWE